MGGFGALWGALGARAEKTGENAGSRTGLRFALRIILAQLSFNKYVGIIVSPFFDVSCRESFFEAKKSRQKTA